ncbi:MAG TPA: two-component sensor histidine kinase, partial [Anaeromyxobacter sp.]
MPSRSTNIRIVLLLHAVAVAAILASVLLVAGLPAAAGRALSPRLFVAIVVGASALAVALGAALLFRTVARPV